jgi:hypothetical protein
MEERGRRTIDRKNKRNRLNTTHDLIYYVNVHSHLDQNQERIGPIDSIECLRKINLEDHEWKLGEPNGMESFLS